MLVFLLIVVVMLSIGEFAAADKKVLFVTVWKILLQHEIQWQVPLTLWSSLLLYVIQLIKFHMNPELTNVILSCISFIFYASITNLKGENILQQEGMCISITSACLHMITLSLVFRGCCISPVIINVFSNWSEILFQTNQDILKASKNIITVKELSI